jgi:hypothetical protein
MNYTFYLVLQLYEDGSTLYQFSGQNEALKRYQKYTGRAIFYELIVGDKPSLREVLRNEPNEESEVEHA